MYHDIYIKKRLADIIEPHAGILERRFSNGMTKVSGSHIVNAVPCPFCKAHLFAGCSDCPLHVEFGKLDVDGCEDSTIDNVGCKRVIRKLWGNFTFGDYPAMTVRTQKFNLQLQEINGFVNNLLR